MVIDQHRNGIPVAWFIHERQTADDFAAPLRMLKDRVRKVKPEWCPSCVFIDDCKAEIKAIGCVGFCVSQVSGAQRGLDPNQEWC